MTPQVMPSRLVDFLSKGAPGLLATKKDQMVAMEQAVYAELRDWLP